MIDILLLSFFSLFKVSISAEVHPSMFCVLRTGPTLFKDECIRRRNGGYRVLSYGKNIGSHGITNDIKHQTRPNSFLSKRLGLLATINDNTSHEDPSSTSCSQITPLSSTARQSSNEKIIPEESKWKEHPSLIELVNIPTLSVPSNCVHSLLSSRNTNNTGSLSSYLATNMEEFDDIHPRLKLVRDLPRTPEYKVNERKLILLDPNKVSSVPNSDWNKINHDISRDCNENKSDRSLQLLQRFFPSIDKTTLELMASTSALPGPVQNVTISQGQRSVSFILNKLLPKEALPPPSSFEQIGHIAHLNLKSRHMPYRKMIGSVMVDRYSPRIKTVVNKVGEVSGPYRTYEMEILAGIPEMNVTVVEDGVTLKFDLERVYWCSRLSGQRLRLFEDEFRAGDIIADAFCGVGALCVQAASKLNCTIYANDLNPDAVKYCRENARINGVKASKFKVSCDDAFDFIQNLSLIPSLPDHLVMNYPLDSADFLGSLRWWPSLESGSSVVPKVHLYTFSHADIDANGNNARDVLDVAIDMVAEGLLPEGGAVEKSYFRREYLDRLGCDVKAHIIRDVAPGKVVVYVTFKVTKPLLRMMQGDFVDI